MCKSRSQQSSRDIIPSNDEKNIVEVSPKSRFRETGLYRIGEAAQL